VALYLVPTPVGNLADMTYRAVEVPAEEIEVIGRVVWKSGRL